MQGRCRRRGRGSVIAICGLTLAFALLFFGLDWLEKQNLKPETRGDLKARYADETIEINGNSYRKRPSLTTILLLGIDQPARNSDEPDDYHSGGNADFLRLIVIDSTEKTISQIQIDRDTIAPVTVLNLIGERTDTRPLQIALSHSYGDGKKLSCELTAEAVSRLLLDTPVPYYAALNLDGIAALNDFVGGVTVPIDDDFSSVDPTMIQGTALRLTGKQAEYFVRSRTDMPIGTNEARMARQQVYLSRLSDILREKMKDDPDWFGALFDALRPYLVTNMTRSYLADTAYRARRNEHLPLIELPGAHEIGVTGYMEFHPDEEALSRIITEVFYRPTE